MANEVNANINIDIDTTAASAGLKALQSQISSFNKSIVTSNASAAAAQRDMLATLTSQIGATKAFSTSMVSVESSVSRLGNAIDKNKLSMGEYFKYGVASSKNFGKVFSKEHNEIMGVAQDRVKRLQTQYIALGQAQNGVTRTMAVRPLSLFNADAAISIQRQQLFNKLLGDGSTSLINFGKNTQWAGRQLMVGFTVPLTIFGSVAGKIFMDLERQVVNFRRVYGDAMTPAGETDQMVKEIQMLGKEFTKYGIAVKDTLGLAADVAAAGAQGDDLVAATAQSTRLATLGMIEMNQAMTATMALQTAFKLSNEELAQSVDFLNAVENQTVLSLDDVSQAIPLVAPIIKGLGGDVQDLAIFLTAMREGGVSASEGANALKSGLASLINPTKAAYTQLDKVGISIDSILSRNKGDIRGIVTEFGSALGELGKFERQQTLAKVFGKYQFARLGALFENISTEGSQASRVVDLTGQSFEQLGELAEKELSAIEESIGMKFTGAVERAKLALAPIGEVFLRVATPIIDFATTLLEKFNELSPGIKQFATILVAGLGVVVPVVIMLIGLFANFAGNALKGAALMNNFFNKLRGGGSALEYLSSEELDAAAAAASLEGKTTSLTSALNIQETAVRNLARAYSGYVASATSAATSLPSGFAGRPSRTMATGGMVGGTGNKDTEPALLTPGEFVMNKESTERFGPILDAMNRGSITELNDGDRLASTQFGNFETQRKDSTASIVRLLSQLVDLSEVDTQRVTEGLRNLERSNQLNKKSVETLIKNLEVMPRNLSQIVDAHVFPQAQNEGSISGAEAKRLATASGSTITAPASLRALDMADIMNQEVAKAARVLPRSDFVAGLPREINSALKDGISAGAFANAFEGVGVEKWAKVIKMSGANAQDAVPEFSLLDAKIIELSRNAERAGLKIGDTADQTKGIIAFGDITRQAADELESSGRSMGIVRKAIEDLDGRFRTFQVGINAEMIPALRNAGFVITELFDESQKLKGYSVLPPKGTPWVNDDGSPRAAATYRAKSQRETAPGNYGVGGYSLGNVAIDEINGATGSESESRRAQQAADNVVEGFSNQLRRGIPDAQSAAKGLGGAAVDALDQSSSRIPRRATRPQGSSGLTAQEIDTELRRQAREERKARGPARGGGGLSPISFRAGEETTRIQNIGNAQDAARREQINRAHDEAIEENTRRMQGSSQENKGQTSKLKKFGNAITKGSMKLQGAMFALDGLVFAASMMDNSAGEFAQKILPAVFAFQGIATTIPLVSGGIKALAAAMGTTAAGLIGILGPLGLVVAALGGLAWVTKMQADKQNETIRANQKYIDATLGSAAAMTNFAKATNKQTILQREAALNMPTPSIGKRQKDFAEEFVESESGKEITESLKQISEGPERIAALRSQLIQAMAAGFLSPKQAKAVARQVSIELKDPIVGNSVITSIEMALTKNGKRLKGIASEIFAGTIQETVIPELKLIEDSVKNISRLPTAPPEGATGRPWLAANAFKLTKEQGGAAFQAAATDATKLREAVALLNIDFDAGKIKQKDYEGQLKNLNDRFRQNIELINGMGVAVQGGSSAVGGFFKNYAVMMGMTEEDFEKVENSVGNIVSGLKNIPSTLETDLKFSVATGGLSLEQLSSLEALFNLEETGEKNKKEFELLLSAGGDYTPEQVTQFYLSIAGFPDEIRKTVQARFTENGLSDAQNYLYVLSSIMGLPPKIRNIIEPQILGAGIEGLKTAKYYLDYLNDIPAKQRKDYIIAVTQLTFRKTMGENLSSAEAAADRGSQRARSAVLRGERQGYSPSTGTDTDSVAKKIQAELDAAIEGIGDTGAGGGGGGGGGAGGGSDTKSWLEGLISETESNLKMFPGIIDKIKNKFPGIPQQIIEMIGGGEEGIKRAQELLGASKQKIKELIANYRKSSIAQALQSIEDRNLEKKRGIRAESILTQRGFDPEDAKSLASNSEDAFAIIQASLTMTEKDFEKFLEPYREYLKLTKETEDPNDKLKEQIDALNDSFKKAVKPIDDQIEAQQELIESINEEIEAIEKLNDADELSIRTKQREVEMLDRSIEAKERLNDADQRTIDSLSREDELRNRVADSLSKELETMSKQEDQIRKSYDERIKSLEQVEKVNQRVLNQEKDRLNISQSLAQGDIYAATEAARQARQNQAQASQEDFRSALQQGMENQIAGLRTEGGLTREQAEAQIESIKQQSYQTSLLIQGVEDKIFARNLEIRTIKDDIQTKSDAIRVIEDAIYERETLILDIQNQRLVPAQSQLDNLVDQKEEMQKILESKVDDLEVQIEQNDLTVEQKNNVDNLAAAWRKVAEQIKNAKDLAANATKILGPIPTPTAGESNENFRARLSTFRANLAKIKLDEKAATDAALASAPNMFAGGNVNYKGSNEPPPAQMMGGGRVMKYGMGKMVKGYAVGKIVGEGSRDSVSAMLTPGEFVIRKTMVDKYGMPLLSSINQGAFSMPNYVTPQSTETGDIKSGSNSATNVVAPMYNNYSVSVNVSGTNASADDIANKTIMKIKQMQNTSIRSGRG